jgi:hypothetical protein
MSELPKLMLVEAKKHRHTASASASASTAADSENHIKYVLFEVSRYNEVPEVVWKWNTVESPGQILSAGQWHADSIETVNEKYMHYRPTTLDEPKFYDNLMKRSSKYITVPGLGNIYVYIMTKPNTILPCYYYQVCAGLDNEKKWHICIDTQKDTKSVTTAYKIPPHIFRFFVDAAIQNKEECPISMEILTRETVASTPCGHLFEKSAISTALQQNKKCPNCRNECSEGQLQMYNNL